MPGVVADVPRFGVSPARQRVLECLLHAEMYLVDTEFILARANAKPFADLRHFRTLRGM